MPNFMARKGVELRVTGQREIVQAGSAAARTANEQRCNERRTKHKNRVGWVLVCSRCNRYSPSERA
jgi:hypothetical protein